MTVVSMARVHCARSTRGSAWKALGMALITGAVALFAVQYRSDASAYLTHATNIAYVGETVSGRASIVDADTLDIHGERIRLNGIDAPESGQRCYDALGKLYRCGAAAANALDRMLMGKTVACKITGTDRYKRLLGTCYSGETDIQEWLVENGYALAYRKYSTAYVAAENRAADAGRGIWAGEFVAPWDWRKGLRMDGEKPTKAMLEGKIAAR